jgi:hypothetical protein
MWMPVHDESVEIYADYLTSRHGRSAYRYARKTADKLHRKGDLAGHAAWNRVAVAVERRGGKNIKVETVSPKY